MLIIIFKRKEAAAILCNCSELDAILDITRREVITKLPTRVHNALVKYELINNLIIDCTFNTDV